MIFNYDELLVDSQEENVSILNSEDLNILLKKDLIKQNNNLFTPSFVGELITPNKKYFSLPKNFQKTFENVKLIKNLILKYKELRDDNGKLLLTNNTFSIQTDGDIESEKFFFTELKGFFLDFITYEFIYPKKKKTIHSYKPLRGGKIDVLNTIKNQNRYGIGTTYKTNDVINTDNWNLDDIYFYTLNKLCQEYGTEKDKADVKEMKDYLISEGYIIKELKNTNIDIIIKDIIKCEVGIIHNPIKNTLLSYYKSIKIGEHYSIDVFYTKRFNIVWEYIIKTVLKHDKGFKKEIVEDFIPQKRSIFTSNIDLDDVREMKAYPDLFSNWNDKKFIGDAKYYTNFDSDFNKEMYLYNQSIKNKYPMVVFIPTDGNTRRYDRRFQGEFELIVILLSSKDVLLDLINNTSRVIDRVQTLISKNTKRWNIVDTNESTFTL